MDKSMKRAIKVAYRHRAADVAVFGAGAAVPAEIIIRRALNALAYPGGAGSSSRTLRQEDADFAAFKRGEIYRD